jgi:hypothetical protein
MHKSTPARAKQTAKVSKVAKTAKKSLVTKKSLKTTTKRKMSSNTASLHKLDSMPSETVEASSSDTELDDNQMKIAMALSGDMRKRVMAQKMKKPTFSERLANTSDLYQDKTTMEITTEDVGTILPMQTEGIQPNFAKGYLKHECQENDGKDGYWLVRQQTIDALNFIDKNTNTVHLHRPRKPDTIYNVAVPNLAILYGHRGTSKSFTLAQAVDYATRRGDIVISISAWDTIHDMDGVIIPSVIPNHNGMYDQIVKTRKFLDYMATTFGDQLKQIPLSLSEEYYASYGNWSASEEDRYNAPADNIRKPELYPFPDNAVIPRPMSTKPGKTLYDLAAMGAWRIDLAGRVATDFLYEVKKQTQFPVFIAIDDVNCIVQKSDFMNPANLRTRLDATRLTFVRALVDCIENPPQHGSTMIATSSNFTSYRIDSYLERAGTQIRTTSYTVLEHQAMLEHYYTSKIILTPMDVEFFRRSQLVTGSQPKSLRLFADAQ